jgi:hypothetical protein
MALQTGRQVEIKNAKHVIGKIVRLRDSDPIGGDVYEVEIDPQHLYIRESNFEPIDVPKFETPLVIRASDEWLAETQRATSIMKAAIDNPNDPTLRKAMVESLDRLGHIDSI